jgi:hypothetical protein
MSDTQHQPAKQDRFFAFWDRLGQAGERLIAPENVPKPGETLFEKIWLAFAGAFLFYALMQDHLSTRYMAVPIALFICAVSRFTRPKVAFALALFAMLLCFSAFFINHT